MPKQKVDEQFIIIESLKLFRQKSYHTTSMSDIASACGLLKGSLYHYFRSKEDLMKKVIHVVHEFFKAEVFSHAYREELSGEERLKIFIQKSEDIFLDRTGTAVYGNVGVETAFNMPEFAELIRDFFRDFFAAIKQIYLTKYPDEVASELAERSVAELEGAILLSRIFNDPNYLMNTHKRLLSRLEK